LADITNLTEGTSIELVLLAMIWNVVDRYSFHSVPARDYEAAPGHTVTANVQYIVLLVLYPHATEEQTKLYRLSITVLAAIEKISRFSLHVDYMPQHTTTDMMRFLLRKLQYGVEVSKDE
jgi:hypothetical protein